MYWQVCDLVDDQQRRAREEADLLPQCAFAFSLARLSDQVGKRDKVDRSVGADGFDHPGRRDVALSGARWSQQVNDLGAFDEVKAGDCGDAVLVERELEREVVAGQRLDH